MPKRRLLKIAERICELRNVCLPSITESRHRCYVELPVSWEPQACLVVATHPTGSQEWFDCLVVLPGNAQYAEVNDNPIYTAALGLIRATYKATITAASKGLRFKGIGFDYLKAEWDEPPFVCTNQTAQHWSPLLLRHDNIKTEWSKNNWDILQSWEQWQRRSLSLEDRANEFYASHESELRSHRMLLARERLDDLQQTLGQDDIPLSNDLRRRPLSQSKLPPPEALYDPRKNSNAIQKQKAKMERMKRRLLLGKFSDRLYYLHLPDSEKKLTGKPKPKEGFKQRQRRRLLEG